MMISQESNPIEALPQPYMAAAFVATQTPFKFTPFDNKHRRTPTPTPTRYYASFKLLSAKLPAGVELSKVEPKFKVPFLGFTGTAEIWNSRACMIGLIGTFIVELILHKGILQTIGVDVGRGLDLPL